jgi:hypothetical protein
MRGLGILRQGVAVGAIGALGVTVAGIGVAAAANGGSLIVGHNNSATKTTTLTNHKGTALSLISKSSKPPLKVNSSRQVAHLNASLLGGKSATALATSGSGEQVPFTTLSKIVTQISTKGAAATKVATTGRLDPGTYYVSSSFNGIGEGTDPTICFVGPDNDLNDAVQSTSDLTNGNQTVALTAIATITSPTTLSESCFGADTGFLGGAIFAIKIAHSKPGSLP